MSGKTIRYEGENITVTYDVKRCIHAEACVKGLNRVFDSKRRPWIVPDNDPADAVATTIHQCPSGALHYDRKDGGQAESIPDHNTIRLAADGPLYVQGDITIINGEETLVLKDTRVALCRCGASHNKPFCDNSHRDIHFEAASTVPNPQPEATIVASGPLEVKTQTNGSLRFTGAFTILDEAGAPVHQSQQEWLCRCGGSAKKPFCDGTHKRNGFTAS
ncbi:MAG: CDGSH iron-sulfur domain-containing protein [Anaerolineae bacterium]|nr:CDGSH iron-sulfur domain-containing protein [Anaerolineae bacterium]